MADHSGVPLSALDTYSSFGIIRGVLLFRKVGNKMYTLGINAAYHESAACLLKDGIVVAAAEEERFNRKKHGKRASISNPQELPIEAIQFSLDLAGITASQIAHIGFSINPFKRLENKKIVDIVEEGSWGSETGEDAFFNNLMLIPDMLRDMGFRAELSWLDHHLCHAASAFYLSPFIDAAVLTIDGIGEVGSTLLAYSNNSPIKVLEEIKYPASLGFLWEKLSKFLGFTEYDACKVMGLAAYGDCQFYRKQFSKLINLLPEGMFELDNDVFRFRVEDYGPLEELFGVTRRYCEQGIQDYHKHIAAGLQWVTNQAVLHIAQHLFVRTRSDNLCLAGGVALNCITNKMILEDSSFANLFIQPAAHDAGTAIGAALLMWHETLKQDRKQALNHVYLGPLFSDAEIEKSLKEQGLLFDRVENIEKTVAELLSQQYIVGWFQGAMEFGPRALGNRSLLADPRDASMREILNKKIKHREDFRPLAPSVLAEEAGEWFEIYKTTPASDFMLVAYKAKEHVRDKIPAVIHKDGTSRIQTVQRATNPRYHQLITEFFNITGVPLVLNTSFNDSEPIVCTPHDAINTFKKTQMDYLAIGSFLVSRLQNNL
jgi:carbamoyltransferase